MKIQEEKFEYSYATEDLRTIERLLNGLNEDAYREKIKLLSDYSIGSHVRHILEFYGCLLIQNAGGLICYDNRERNGILETDPGYARAYIADLIRYVDSNIEDSELILEAKTGLQDDSKVRLRSSYSRELYYCFEHSIHHQALIKVALNEMDLVEMVSEDFGVAPSTIRYHKKR
ncbi:MAG: hypothetical protein HYZ14_08795 [Bacteroidetes bacterium]|nr:hypothetical protein [Bacteroidota bacterium]